ncbi:MAG: ABC transporter permease [Ekhidna sp.]
MIKKSVLITWRNIRKNPFIYLLKMIGLSVGLTVFLFVLTYVHHEYSYDRFHESVDQVFRINHIVEQEGKDPYVGAATFPRVGPALKSEFGQVLEACRLVEVFGGGVAIVDNNPIKHEKLLYAEPSFFEIFSFELLSGSKRAFENVHTVMLSKRSAMQHFGTIDCVGKIIKFRTRDGSFNFAVAGVFDSPGPTHIEAEALLSFSSLVNIIGREEAMNWRWFDFVTYIKLRPDTDLVAFDEQLKGFIDKHGGERLGSDRIDFDLINVGDIHLDSKVSQELSTNGDRKATTFLLIIGLFTLVIAWINYINLYTAKAIDRSKEVGIRKTLGSDRKQLIAQFFIESAWVNLFAIVAGVGLFTFLRSLAAIHLGIVLPMDHESVWLIGFYLVVLWVLSVVFSGTYPAIFISRFKILDALKGSVPSVGNVNVRKWLVVFQFMISGFMIGGTFLVFMQLQFMRDQPIGLDVEQTMVLEITNYESDSNVYVRKLESLKNSLLQEQGVKQVAYTSEVPGLQVGWRGSSFKLESNPERHIVYKMTVSRDYLSFIGARFLAGRNFQTPSDSTTVVINESALSMYGFGDPNEAINKPIRFAGLDTLRVLGVVGDYFQESLREAIKPTVFLNMAEELKYLVIKSDHQDLEKITASTKANFSALFPQTPFEPYWLDDVLAARYREEAEFNMLFNAFSSLAILISFLGLLGLAYYTAAKRRKEVGVRKVLGASTPRIILLVFRDFSKLVVLGNIIGFPMLWFLGSKWLNNFSYRIDFPWPLPLIVMLASVLFAFIFTFSQLNQLGRTNPVEVLKDE